MGLQRIVNPVEYSFYQWMSGYPDSGHPADKSRFYTFARTIFIHNATNWKKSEYVRQRILKKKPNFDPHYLEYLLRLLDELIQFSNATPVKGGVKFTHSEVKDNHVRTMRVKNDELYVEEVPLNHKKS
ncbi:MAG: hypothetical protein WAU61_08935 [Smithella sp.]